MHWRVPLRRAMGRSRLETGGGGEGGGDKGAGTGAIGEEGDSGSKDGSYGRESEGGDTSGKGIETVIGRSLTGVADVHLSAEVRAGSTGGDRDGLILDQMKEIWINLELYFKSYEISNF